MSQDLQPKKWKMAVLIWLFIYPIVTIVSMLLFPIMDNFSGPIKTLAMTSLLVPIMAWWYIPFINRVFFNWLRK